MRGSVRGSDVVCRIGGEEFAVILPETDANSAAQLAVNTIRIAFTPRPGRWRFGGARVVGPDSLPAVAVARDVARQHPSPDPDRGAGVVERFGRDACGVQLWQPARVDLHQADVPAAVAVGGIHREWIETALGLGDCAQQIGSQTVVLRCLLEARRDGGRRTHRHRQGQ